MGFMDIITGEAGRRGDQKTAYNQSLLEMNLRNQMEKDKYEQNTHRLDKLLAMRKPVAPEVGPPAPYEQPSDGRQINEQEFLLRGAAIPGMSSVFTPAFTASMKPSQKAESKWSSFLEGKNPDTGKVESYRIDQYGQKQWAGPIAQTLDPKAAKATFDSEVKLRKEFLDLTKNYRTVEDAHQRILASSEDPSAAGDLAMIFNYMKVLDPGSTVREGEFANAQNSGSVPEVVRGMYNKVISGQRLSKNMRNDFLNRSWKLYGKQLGTYKRKASEYQTLAERKGIDPQNVVLRDISLIKGEPDEPIIVEKQPDVIDFDTLPE